MCPVEDLVELTFTVRAASPNTALIALVSLRSFACVEVPWALMYWMSLGATPASCEGAPHRALGALALGSRRRDVVRVARGAVAGDLGVDARAALLGVLQFLESRPPRRPRP